MDIDLNGNRESLIVKDKTVDLICEKAVQFFQKMPSAEIFDAIDSLAELYEKGFVDVLPDVAMNVAILNTNSIFQLAESAIEKIFLNALNIIAFPYVELCIFLTPQLNDIKHAQFRESIEVQKYVHELWERFRKEIDEHNALAFMNFLNEVDFLTEGQRARIIWYIIHEYISRIYGIFYISLQPPMKDILSNGRVMRPDIYIWHPYDPNFKLIVECDGYTYHSDKSSFSNDRARDRLLHMKGYHVLRFSGHDIFTNPTEMAKELHQYLVEKKREIKPIYLT